MFKMALMLTSDSEGTPTYEEEDFHRFVHVLSSLMKDEVKQELVTFFKICDGDVAGKFSGDNVAFCNLMRQKGIISPANIAPLTDALSKCDKEKLKGIVAELFTLYVKGKLGASTTEEEKGDNFKRFLNMLSVLLTKDVREALESFFDISEIQSEDESSDANVVVCNILKEKSIVSPFSIKPLIIVLTVCRKRRAIEFALEMFKLFEEGSLDTWTTLEEEKGVEFQRFLDILSLLMTKDVRERLESLFDHPKIQPCGKFSGENYAFCNFLRQKGIISPFYIELLTNALEECGKRDVATISKELFRRFKEGKLWASIRVEEEKGIVTIYDILLMYYKFV